MLSPYLSFIEEKRQRARPLETATIEVHQYDTPDVSQKALTTSTTRNRRSSDQASCGIRMEHIRINGTCIHHHLSTTQGQLEAVQASRSGTIEELAVNIIVRTVTRALKAEAVITERNSTSQVDTALIECKPV